MRLRVILNLQLLKSMRCVCKDGKLSARAPKMSLCG
jgi:hypothetical protein